MATKQVVDESQAASFATQTALADAGKVAVLVETLALEDCHDALILHPSVSNNGVENDGTMCIDVLQALPCDAFQELRYGEEGTRGEPAAHVIVGNVIEKASRRKRHDVVLQVLQVVKSRHFLHRVRVSEDEITEAKVVAKVVAQVHINLLRVLVDETCVAFFGKFGILGFARIEDEGHVWVASTNGAQQLETSRLVLFPSGSQGKTAVADNTKCIVGKAIVEEPCFFIIACEHNLWPSAHSEHFETGVERFGGKLQTLLQDELVKRGQDAGIEANTVLNDQ